MLTWLRRIAFAVRRIEREKYDHLRNQQTIDVVVDVEILEALLERWMVGEFLLRRGEDGRYVLVGRTFDSIQGLADVEADQPSRRQEASPWTVYRTGLAEDLAAPDGFSFLSIAVPDDALDEVQAELRAALGDLGT